MNLLELLLFCNVHQSKLRDNFRVDLLLGRIFVSSVVLLSATVRNKCIATVDNEAFVTSYHYVISIYFEAMLLIERYCLSDFGLLDNRPNSGR